MSKPLDLTGHKFSRWTVARRAGSDKRGHSLWARHCECGRIKYVSGHNLVTGGSTMCAHCAHALQKFTHRQSGARNFKRSRTYSSWAAMRNRCNNPNTPHYKYYGARGVTVCQRWRKFENFLADMGERPAGKTLDRKNNDGNYTPCNCRWATPQEQASNRRKHHEAA